MSVIEKVWIDIGAASDIPQRGARTLRTSGACIAVFRTAEDEYFALEDSCPHKSGPLSQGIVHGSLVTCPLHNWVIDLASGKAQGADEGCVATIALRVDGGRLLLDAAALSQGKPA